MLVTSADRALGGLVVRRILREGGEVRAYGSPGGDMQMLKAAGAVIAVGDTDDGGLLEAALAEVHTVIHPVTGLLAASVHEVMASTQVMIAAAVAAGVKRIVVLSLPGASVTSEEQLRQAHGRLEAVLRATPLPTVALRVGLTDSPGMRDALASLRLRADLDDHAVAPIRTDDLVELLAAIDSLRSTVREGHAVLQALGAEPLTIGQYRERTKANADTLVGRVYVSPDRVPLLADALAGPWVTDDDITADAWVLLGLRPRHISI